MTLRDVLALVGFFSRLPVPASVHAMALRDAVWAMPLASLVIAAPAAALMALAAWAGAGPLAAAIVGVAALTIMTGALHEDGLADCADGFWGGADPPRRLDIMRDSRVGSYGVLALVFATLLKVALLAAALQVGVAAAVAGFLAAAVAGRTVALYPWVGLPAARADGLAAGIGRPLPAAFRTAVVLALAVTAALTLWFGILAFVAAGAAAALAAQGVASLANAKLGGHTGDVIGATVIISDLSYLAAFTMCLP